jgi:hypothetical protein
MIQRGWMCPLCNPGKARQDQHCSFDRVFHCMSVYLRT